MTHRAGLSDSLGLRLTIKPFEWTESRGVAMPSSVESENHLAEDVTEMLVRDELVGGECRRNDSDFLMLVDRRP